MPRYYFLRALLKREAHTTRTGIDGEAIATHTTSLGGVVVHKRSFERAVPNSRAVWLSPSPVSSCSVDASDDSRLFRLARSSPEASYAMDYSLMKEF